MSQSTTPPRLRFNFKSKHSPERPVAAKGSPSPSHKAIRPDLDVKKDSKAKLRSSLMANKPQSGDHLLLESQKVRQNEHLRLVVARPAPTVSARGPVVQQFARPRPRRTLDSSTTRNEQERNKELHENLELKETLIKELQSEVWALKAELDKAHNLNKELESQNKKLAEDLAAAESKVSALNTRSQESTAGDYHSRKFKDIQKLIANKLQRPTVRRDEFNGPSAVTTTRLPPPPPPLSIQSPSKVGNAERKAPSLSPPPPPPPPPMRLPHGSVTVPKAKTPATVEFCPSLRKQDDKRQSPGPGNQYKLAVHSSIVGEIQNRSAHLLAIKTDIETKGDFINGLIQKVLAAVYTDIEDVLKFVDWLDGELSLLADERAVLRHFKWPERKADAIREAAIEYRSLRLLESEISCYKDDINIPCGPALKRISVLLDKSECSIQRLIKLRNTAMQSYEMWKIPTDWMLDSGILSKIKQSSIKLAKAYMNRVVMELELGRNSDRECNQEALLLRGVHFAYRAQQFAGGLDSETLCAFEEIRERVPGHLGGSLKLLAAMPST